ncbi:MAG TPA: LytTR family DNA-binding domain-containing protein [Bacteroidota bacterium]|nr:LytTR family DNA-binding domain-containing protein [Bacteroidota bacterium]
MNVLVIEDELYSARRLEKMLNELAPELHILALLESVAQSVRWLSEHPAPDLIFMDIQLSDGSSFEIFDKTTVASPVIFITAYDEYALQAFKVNSIDYLLKPIDRSELARSLEKFNRLNQHPAPPINPDVSQIIKSLQEAKPNYKTRFLVKTGQTFITIFTQDIAYFFADHKLVYLVTREGKKHLIDQTLEELEDQLDPKIFFRLNRQFVASVNAIVKLHNYFNHKLKVELIPPTDIEILISREKAPEFKTWLNE